MNFLVIRFLHLEFNIWLQLLEIRHTECFHFSLPLLLIMWLLKAPPSSLILNTGLLKHLSLPLFTITWSLNHFSCPFLLNNPLLKTTWLPNISYCLFLWTKVSLPIELHAAPMVCWVVASPPTYRLLQDLHNSFRNPPKILGSSCMTPRAMRQSQGSCKTWN